MSDFDHLIECLETNVEDLSKKIEAGGTPTLIAYEEGKKDAYSNVICGLRKRREEEKKTDLTYEEVEKWAENHGIVLLSKEMTKFVFYLAGKELSTWVIDSKGKIRRPEEERSEE